MQELEEDDILRNILSLIILDRAIYGQIRPCLINKSIFVKPEMTKNSKYEG